MVSVPGRRQRLAYNNHRVVAAPHAEGTFELKVFILSLYLRVHLEKPWSVHGQLCGKKLMY